MDEKRQLIEENDTLMRRISELEQVIEQVYGDTFELNFWHITHADAVKALGYHLKSAYDNLNCIPGVPQWPGIEPYIRATHQWRWLSEKMVE